MQDFSSYIPQGCMRLFTMTIFLYFYINNVYYKKAHNCANILLKVIHRIWKSPPHRWLCLQTWSTLIYVSFLYHVLIGIGPKRTECVIYRCHLGQENWEDVFWRTPICWMFWWEESSKQGWDVTQSVISVTRRQGHQWRNREIIGFTKFSNQVNQYMFLDIKSSFTTNN